MDIGKTLLVSLITEYSHSVSRVSTSPISRLYIPLCHAEEVNSYRGICAGCTDKRLHDRMSCRRDP